MSLNVGEYGLACAVNVNFDLIGATSLLLEFVRPDLTVFGGAADAPNTALVTPSEGTYTAGQYARYIFKPGDLNQPGDYIVRLAYVGTGPKRIISDPASFAVYP